MNQTPGRHPRRIVFARLLIGADCDALKQIENRARGRIQLRVFRPLDQNGPEHQAKETTLLQGEINVSETHRMERVVLGCAGFHRRGELPEALRRDRRKEILLVGKMAIRGRCGHSDAAGRLPQANDVRAGFIQNAPRGRAQGVGEISTVIGTSRRIREIIHIQTPWHRVAPKICPFHEFDRLGHFPVRKMALSARKAAFDLPGPVERRSRVKRTPVLNRRQSPPPGKRSCRFRCG